MRPEDLLDRARSLAPGIRDRAFAAEQARRVPEETIEELKAAGLFRALQPARYGGHEVDPQVFMEAAMIIGAACGSTGWVYSVVGVHNWQLGLMPKQAQDDVWGEDPDVLISSSYTPRGKVDIVDGGYRLSGRWSFSSGSDHCQWAILGGVATEEDGTVRRLCFLLPRTDYTIDDVWNVVGLRGSGSNDVVVEDAFVPELPHAPVHLGQRDVRTRRSTRCRSAACSRSASRHRCSARRRAPWTTTSAGPPSGSGSAAAPGSRRSRSRRRGWPRRPASWTARGCR